MYAVVGATGNTGRAVVKELKALGADPVCVVRNPDKARKVLGSDAKVATAELTDRASLEAALAGAKRIFLVTGHNPGMVEQQTNVLDAAKAAGAELMVRVSGGAAVCGPDAESFVGRGHHQIEQAMQKSGLDWVNLRPGLFMQNTFAQAANIKSQSKIVLPFPAEQPLAFIDVRDTGALGARVLLEPEAHVGKTIEFTGLTTDFGEFAGVFSEVLGRKIDYVAAALEQAEAGMTAAGLPDWLVGHLLIMAKAAAAGAFDNENTQPIRDICGRAPLTTRQFVEDHRAVFE